MKANELRIGNYVLINDTLVQMKSFHGLCNIESKPEEFEPIPLTEEWLIKFGLFKNNNAWVLNKPSSDIRKFEFSIWKDLTYNTAELQPDIKHVHQLQNLYFALTGEELKTSSEGPRL